MAERSGEERPAGNVRKALAWGLLSVCISVAAIVAVFHYTGSQNPLRDVLRVGGGTLAIAVVMVAGSWLVDGTRLWTLARTMGGSISYLESVRISVAGAFMSGVTPSDTGGEALKVYYLHRDGMSVGQATATVTLVAMLHATTRFLLWLIVPLIAFFTGFSLQFPPTVKAALTLGLLLYVFFMSLLVASTLWPEVVVRLAAWLFNTRLVRRYAPPDLLRKVEGTVKRVAVDFREGMMKLRTKGTQVVFAFVLSALYWVVVISVPVFLLHAMGSSASSFQIFSLSMTVYLVMAYVPTPGASGGAEIGSAVFFAPFLPARVLGTFVVVWRVVTYYLTLLIGGIIVVVDTLKHSLRKTKLQSP